MSPDSMVPHCLHEAHGVSVSLCRGAGSLSIRGPVAPPPPKPTENRGPWSHGLPTPQTANLESGPCPHHWVSVGGFFLFSQPRPASLQDTRRPCKSGASCGLGEGGWPLLGGSLSLAGPCPPGLRKPITFAFHLESRQLLPWANDTPIE